MKKIAILLCVWLPQILFAVEFHKADEVALTKEAPLYFENNFLRNGNADERFTVLQTRASEHKVFVSSKDAAGKAIALSVSDDALVLVSEGFSLPNVNAFGYAGNYISNPRVDAIRDGLARISNPATPGGNSLITTVPVRFVPSALIERYEMVHSRVANPPKSVAPQPVLPLPPELPLPPNGLLGNSAIMVVGAPFVISAGSSGTHYLVKLVDVKDGQTKINVFVNGGTVSVLAPEGKYIVKIAAGEKWYGERHLFGPNGSYTQTSKVFQFTEHGGRFKGFKVTFSKASFGNLPTQMIKPEDF
jgi:hypothetical protein